MAAPPLGEEDAEIERVNNLEPDAGVIYDEELDEFTNPNIGTKLGGGPSEPTRTKYSDGYKEAYRQRFPRGMYSKDAIAMTQQGVGEYMRPSQGGLYAISTDAVISPSADGTAMGENSARVKVGVANHYDTRLNPYETTLPDGFNVHYLMTMPTGDRKGEDDLAGSRTNKLRQENLLKTWMSGGYCDPNDPDSDGCRVSKYIRPINNANEWYEAVPGTGTDADGVIEWAKKGMQWVHKQGKFPSTLLDAKTMEPVPGDNDPNEYHRPQGIEFPSKLSARWTRGDTKAQQEYLEAGEDERKKMVNPRRQRRYLGNDKYHYYGPITLPKSAQDVDLQELEKNDPARYKKVLRAMRKMA